MTSYMAQGITGFADVTGRLLLERRRGVILEADKGRRTKHSVMTARNDAEALRWS
jgi:hypothetical protein